MYDISFKHPTTILVSGATGSGKTCLVRQLLEHHKLLMPAIGKNRASVLWCFGIYQDLYSQPIKNVDTEYYEGLINESDLRTKKPDILIVDDLMSEKSEDKSLANLFSRGSHHLGITVIFIVQNLFPKGLRTISLNSQYLLLMKNPRDKSQIACIGKQLYPGHTKFFREVFEDATKSSYSYLLVDLTPTCPEELRLRTNIIPVEGKLEPIVYSKK